MSGVTSLTIKSDAFLLTVRTPSVRFRDRESERKYHDRKRGLFGAAVKALQPELDSFFAEERAGGPVKLGAYSEGPPLLEPGRRAAGKCRCLMHLPSTGCPAPSSSKSPSRRRPIPGA